MRDAKQHWHSRGNVLGIPFAYVCQFSSHFLLCSIVMVFSLTSLFLAFGLENEVLGQLNQQTEVRPAVPRWNYHGFQGPRFWGFLEKANKECRIGHQQSPIDVVMPHHPDHQEKLEFEYSQTQFAPVQTEHGVQFRPSGTPQLQLNSETYQLKQFHFHDPSEHHIRGKEFPLEMHLVHESQEGHLLVVALLFRQGAANQDMADILRLSARLQHSRTIQNVKNDTIVLRRSAFNLLHLLPENLQHFSYHGSLTTPPCTEGVQWIILRTPVQLSPSQLVKLKTLYGVNARPVQPLYNRDVYGY